MNLFQKIFTKKPKTKFISNEILKRKNKTHYFKVVSWPKNPRHFFNGLVAKNRLPR